MVNKPMMIYGVFEMANKKIFSFKYRTTFIAKTVLIIQNN